jgi:hypothetical protein
MKAKNLSVIASRLNNKITNLEDMHDDIIIAFQDSADVHIYTSNDDNRVIYAYEEVENHRTLRITYKHIMRDKEELIILSTSIIN